MVRRKNLLFVVILTLFVLLNFMPTVSAMPRTCADINNVSQTGISGVTTTVSFQATLAAGDTIYAVASHTNPDQINIGSNGSTVASGNYPGPVSYVIPSTGTFNLVFQFTGTANGSISYQLGCNASTAGVGSGVGNVNVSAILGSFIIPFDNRINPGNGDNDVALYPSEDSEGNPAIQAYAINEDSVGEFLLSVTEEDLAPYQDEPLTDNVFLKSEGAVSAYLLTTGEIQFNILGDNKITVFIVSALSATGGYSYTIEPLY